MSASQAESLSVEPVINDYLFPTDMPGYLGCACEFEMDGSFDEAKITFTMDDDIDPESVDPVIYYFNEEEQDLEPLETTVEGNQASAVTTHFSKYILVNRIEYMNSWR